MGQVLVFGSINTDLVTYIAALPAQGETVIGGKFETFPGGKGANQAVASARVGATVEMFACLGDDSLGRERMISLEKAGVSTRNILVKAGSHSGIAQIMVDAQGNNLIAIASGANSRLTPGDIILPEPSGNELKVALFQNEIPQQTTEAVIKECKKGNMLTLWNTAPACQQKPARDTLESLDSLICNHLELQALVGQGDETTAVKLLSWGVKNVIVTLGERGSLLVSDEGMYYQSIFPAQAIDTVGAGDCFCGVFACSLSFGTSVKESLRRASAAAALSVTRKGAQTAMPTKSEIDAFLSSSKEPP